MTFRGDLHTIASLYVARLYINSLAVECSKWTIEETSLSIQAPGYRKNV